ncbi:hypothetical protein M378DRAFT_19349 [Amanita muscaria Koide BX008]|uniref:Uncharacterized protein n=1 Tax=Amanita muscaria (strain Koide BX008) TaxID=946122 RepID=A0A0C2WD51_AMAMK|nr:hypothetical protein M378DRAFT_19349 [Amanita muscaria Koide BX008]
MNNASYDHCPPTPIAVSSGHDPESQVDDSTLTMLKRTSGLSQSDFTKNDLLTPASAQLQSFRRKSQRKERKKRRKSLGDADEVTKDGTDLDKLKDSTKFKAIEEAG